MRVQVFTANLCNETPILLLLLLLLLLRSTTNPLSFVVVATAADATVCPAPLPAQEGFLSAIQRLGPDLCVTAAYGGMLPQSFLDIPRLGTLNIHPSLLPRCCLTCLVHP